jgi:endonuclease/exonuclease/phosphatase family metal-dependent hydrolase
VIAGDLNAQPGDPEVVYDGVSAIDQLLLDPRLQDPGPRGARTADWRDGVRVDYVLPSADLQVTSSGVFDPDPADHPEGARRAETASDHRLVWVDLAWSPDGRRAGER